MTMLRVTKLTDYATVVLSSMADTPGRVHNATELAERAHLELPTVSKLLKTLAQAGLVEGFRGSAGGYRLAKPAAQISLIHIVEAIEGPLGMTECSGEHSNCEHETHCGVRSKWLRINDVVANALRGVSLAEMMPTSSTKSNKSDSGKNIPLHLAKA
jgi:FeS assembly SUF system regulator